MWSGSLQELWNSLVVYLIKTPDEDVQKLFGIDEIETSDSTKLAKKFSSYFATIDSEIAAAIQPRNSREWKKWKTSAKLYFLSAQKVHNRILINRQINNFTNNSYLFTLIFINIFVMHIFVELSNNKQTVLSKSYRHNFIVN